MKRIYSTWEAKARFSEVLRQVRLGDRAVITWHGKEIVEIVAIDSAESPIDSRLATLERDGVLVSPERPRRPLRGLASRSGALDRFLEDRE